MERGHRFQSLLCIVSVYISHHSGLEYVQPPAHYCRCMTCTWLRPICIAFRGGKKKSTKLWRMDYLTMYSSGLPKRKEQKSHPPPPPLHMLRDSEVHISLRITISVYLLLFSFLPSHLRVKSVSLLRPHM